MEDGFLNSLGVLNGFVRLIYWMFFFVFDKNDSFNFYY